MDPNLDLGEVCTNMNKRLSELIRKKFPVDTMAPGEYAARLGHKSLFLEQHYDHGDQDIEEWLGEVLCTLRNPEAYTRVRQQFLTNDQKAEIDRHLALVGDRLREAYPVEALTPEEYVGRYSHASSSLRFHSQLHHGDRTLQNWFCRVIDFLDDYDQADKLRHICLSSSELAQVEEQISRTRSELRQRYPIDTMEPEEFVSWHSHGNPYMVGDERHFDQEIRDWLSKVEQLLKSPRTRDVLREKFLDPDELQEVRLHQTKLRNVILEQFPIDTITVEEFAARYAHTIYLLGVASFDHGDQKITDWFDELQLIMANETLLNELRQRLLSPDELNRVESEIREQSEPGYVL